MLHGTLPESVFSEWLPFANWQGFFKRLTLSELRGKTLRLGFFRVQKQVQQPLNLGRISELGFRFVPEELRPEWTDLPCG
jgi:hypothetical protein